ncbi:hypothetical protein ACODNH_05440 [Haloarcula sp. NS06]|uniref:hypothetical protein n=1 Tax=Haloarcula sp. NS06 TaxID=3409688 RepID=UPI003DA73A1F
MQDYISPSESSTVPDEAALVGTDSEGRVHYYMAAKAHDERVFVIDGDAVQVFDLAGTGRDIEDWVGHVNEWADCRYGEGFGAMLERGLEAGA